ncbi:MAG: MFS transporter [Verrucomicrobia bacterium]|nr:MFS transporter [Verrucomicrobiota bacterium]
MQARLVLRLSIFMFLQYVIWGSWYVAMGSYLFNTLKFTGDQIGLAYGAFAVGAMISPFLTGLLADRWFATEKMIAVFNLIGAGLLFLLSRLTTFGAFYPVLIAYCALYVPTVSLGNSLSFHHLANAEKDFPRVKIWSAFGWIVAGQIVSLINAENNSQQFVLAAMISLALGIYSFTLPPTPPKNVGQKINVGQMLGVEALALFRRPSFAVFVLSAFLICIPLYFYFVMMATYLGQLGWTKIAAKMTVAQFSDMLFLALLPWFLRKIGYKKTLLLGMLAWFTRYFLMAYGNSPSAAGTAMLFAAIALHGICYDFLFITGQMYVDEQANERIRGAAQGLIAFVLWGVGAFVGTKLAGLVMDAHKLPQMIGAITHDWRGIWMIPALLAGGVLVLFAAAFRENGKKSE